jgi:hypothetical protein
VKVELEHHLPCQPEAVRTCLLSGRFWEEFLRNGDAIDPEIELDEEAHSAHVRWKVAIPKDVPKIVRVLVGSQVRLDLRLPLKNGEEWRLDLDARANASGRLRTNPQVNGIFVEDAELTGW